MTAISPDSRAKLKNYLAKEATFGEKVARGFIEEEGLLDNVGNYLASEFPNTFAGKFFVGSDKFGTGWRSAKQIHGDFFMDMSPQQRRDYLARGNDYRIGFWNDKTESETVKDYYSHVTPGGLAYGLGAVGAHLASPEIALPGSVLLKGAKGVAVAGGMYGALSATAKGLAEKGEVDARELAMYTAGGAAAGLVVGKVADAAVNFNKNRIKDRLGTRVLDEELDTYDMLQDHVSAGAKPTVKPRIRIKPEAVPVEPKKVSPETRLKDGQTQAANTLIEEDELAVKVFDETYPDGSAQLTKLEKDIGAPAGRAKETISREETPFMSPLAEKLTTKMGRESEWGENNNTFWQKTVYSLADGNILAQPYKVIRSMGREGQEIVRRLDSALERTNMVIADGIADYNKIFRKYGSDETVVNNILRKIPQGAVSKKDMAAAKELKVILDRQVTNAVKAGVISQKEGSEMLAKAAKDGYWPRVYDKDFLLTREGRNLFEERLQGIVFKNDKEAERIIGALTGMESSDLRALLKGSKTITPSMARLIYKSTGARIYANRSRHLENDRIFPEELEELLQPFLINDPKAALISYLQDTGNRIEHAKLFGAKDEKFDSLRNSLARRYGTESSRIRSLDEVYHTAIRSAQSQALESFLNKPAGVRSAARFATNITNYKLAFAPIYNVGQSAINGTTQLQRLRGGINPVRTYVIGVESILKGIKSMTPLAKKEAVDDLDRIGGAINTVIMSTIGEAQANALQQGFVRRGGVFNPINWTNSSNFLRYVGYVGTEIFNRRVGQYMGKALVEANLERKAAIQAKTVLSNYDKRQLLKIDKVLDELGLDITKPAVSTSIREANQAAQRFSNQMNFINAAHTIPTTWQTMYGRIFTKFKSFIINQTGFIGDNVIAPMKKGDFLPAMTYFGVGTPVGMTLDQFRRMVMADDESYTNSERLARGWMAFGALGIGQDMARQTLRSPSGLLDFAAGPIVTEAVSTAYATAKTAASPIYQGELDFSPLYKQLAGQFVYPGKTAVQKQLRDEKKNWQKEFKDFKTPGRQFVDEFLGKK